MAEYILRESVEEMLENAQIISDGVYSGYCTEDICVSDIPTADVAPVVHGRWVHIDGELHRCSVCRAAMYYQEALPDGPTVQLTEYCPACGAKMDKEGE